MKLLLTGASSDLGRLLAEDLRRDHDLRLTDPAELVTDLDFVRSDLGHDESIGALVAGVHAIIHTGYVPSGPESANQWLDANTRCTYNLLLAAADAGVSRVLYLSTLDMFRAYDVDLAVAEDWRPRPSLEADELGPYMGEFVAREFAHSGELEVVVLRLGHVVTAEQARQVPFDPMWIDARDVGDGVRAALGRPVRGFGVFHLQHVSDRARFAVRRERRVPPKGHGPGGAEHRRGPAAERRRPARVLAFTPRHNFEEHA